MSNETNSSDASVFDCGLDQKPKNPANKKAQYAKAEYDIFLRLKPREEAFRVRLASNPKNFTSHWMAFKSLTKAPIRSPAYSSDEKQLDIAWAEGDWMPQRRHACLVFDREDCNHLKIMEAGDSVFEHFGNWSKLMKVNPSSNEGTDWLIMVKINAGGNTEYSALPDMKPTPFTEEEKKILENPPFTVDKIIKLKTPEQMLELWMQLPDDKKYNPKSKYKAGEVFNKEKFLKKYANLVKSLEEIEKASKAPKADEPVPASKAEAAPKAEVSNVPSQNDEVNKDNDLPF